MPITVPKAPADWRMSGDQISQVQSDTRLKNLSRDELYLYFNKPKAQATAPAKPAQPQPQGRGLGWVARRVTEALRGGK